MRKIRNYMVGLLVAGFLSTTSALADGWFERHLTELDNSESAYVANLKASIGDGGMMIACVMPQRELMVNIYPNRGNTPVRLPVMEIVDTYVNDYESLTEPFYASSYINGGTIIGVQFTPDDPRYPYSYAEFLTALDNIREFGQTYKTPFGEVDVYFHSLEGIKDTKAWEYCAESN